MTQDRARMWQRVSTGNQDEASQLPDMIKWCDAHGYSYDAAQTYTVHGKSAYHNQHMATVDAALDDMASDEYNVLVVWAFDRIQRPTALAAFQLAERVRQAGGRIEYVKDTHLNTVNDMSDVMLALSATVARKESERKSERIIAKHDALRSAGSVVGRAPWGYSIVKRDGIKVLAPTADGARYIPAIFQLAIDGSSLREIAQWLDAHDVSTMSGNRWNEGYVGNRVIKNPVYYGARRNAGKLDTQALVTYSTWQAANAALATRVRTGRSATAHDAALLKPVCGNQDCDATGQHPSPMYRVFTGKARTPYYRCTGSGPQRKGCGNMVPMAELDSAAIDAMLNDSAQHTERQFITGDDTDDQVGKLRQAASEAILSGDSDAAMALMAQASELDSQPRTRAHWELVETDQTVGAWFGSLDSAAQRAELLKLSVSASMDSDESGRFPVVTIGPRDM